MKPSLPAIRSDDSALDAAFAAWKEAIERASDVRGGGTVRVAQSQTGTTIGIDSGFRRMVRLSSGSGGAYPYSGTEVYAVPSGGWATYPGANPLTPIYEENGAADLSGAVVEIGIGKAGDWRFEYIRAKERAANFATVCASVAQCDGTGEVLILTFNGPGGFTATCTTVKAIKSATCCVMVPQSGMYCVTTGGQTHCVNVTGPGTWFVGGFCLDGAGGTKFTACIAIVDCSGLPRSAVTVSWPDGSMSISDASGNACACTISGAGTIDAPEAGYVNLPFTVPVGLVPCSSNNLFPVKNLGASLAATYSCAGCVPGGTVQGDLRSPYVPPTQLTDSVCGGATQTSVNHWSLFNAGCGGDVTYTLSCSGFGTLNMSVRFVAGGLTITQNQAVWVQLPGGPFVATFVFPAGAVPARTVSVSA